MIKTNLKRSVTKNINKIFWKIDNGFVKNDEETFNEILIFGANCFKDGRRAGFRNAVVCLMVGGALYYWYKKRPVKEESSDDSEGM